MNKPWYFPSLCFYVCKMGMEAPILLPELGEAQMLRPGGGQGLVGFEVSQALL